MDGRNVIVPSQRLRDLLDAVTASVQDDHVSILRRRDGSAQALDNRVVIFQPGVDNDDRSHGRRGDHRAGLAVGRFGRGWIER